MDARVGIIVALVLIAIAAVVVGVVVARHRRKAKLQQEFGPEYDRAVREVGPRRADAALLAREKRVSQFRLRALTTDEWQSFSKQWRSVQSQFVDDPVGSVAEADALVDRLMAARGYPMGDFEQRAADLSVGHASVVENYRAAHAIAMRHQEGETNTEDLRNAFIHYRALFTELLQRPGIRTKAVA